jgi:nucleotide-binding universal stress UspA family protein
LKQIHAKLDTHHRLKYNINADNYLAKYSEGGIIMRILVPVDGSKASLNAIEEAIKIARKEDSVIKLLMVANINLSSDLGNLMFTHGNSNEYDDDFIEIYKKNAAELLDSIAKKYEGIKFEKEVVEGEPYIKILEIAENEKVDYIVMGNRGFSKIKQFFLGSVAQRVIAEARSPVVVVHAEADD